MWEAGVAIPKAGPIFPEGIAAEFRKLNLEPTFVRSEVARSFRKMMKACHPDRYASHGLSKEQAESVRLAAARLSECRERIEQFYKTFGILSPLR